MLPWYMDGSEKGKVSQRIKHLSRAWKRISTDLLPSHAVCGILVPRSRTEPRSLAVRARNPNQWTAREFPRSTSLFRQSRRLFPGKDDS